MGRQFWTKHIGDGQDHKQPGCISGLINVLDYHHWHSNTRNMTHHNKYAGQTGDYPCEVEKLWDEKQSPFPKTKRAHANSKRSLKSRIKALIAEEMYKESSNAQTKESFLFKSRLQRTYSIHHLESLDDSISKICTDWKDPIIFIPSKVENLPPPSVAITQTKPADSNEASGGESDIVNAANIGLLEKTDFLGIFKIDKELFVRNMQISDESVNRFSQDGLASNGKLKLSKSRSFPYINYSQRLKFKPSKLADKQKEIWSFRKGENLQAVSREQKLASSDESDQDPLIEGEIQQRNEWMAPSDIIKGVVDIRGENTMSRIGENTTRIYSHSSSSSLNESLDKYARLFENSYGTDAKMNPCMSLRFTNENGHASMYSRWIRSHSLSNADSFYSNLNLGVAGDDAFGNDSFVIERNDSFRQDVVEDEEKVVRLVARDSEKEPLDLLETVEWKTESVDDMQSSDAIDESSEKWEDFKEEALKQKNDDFFCVPENVDGSDPCSISDLYTISQEKLSASEQLKIYGDKFVESVGHATDSGYVRLILDQSGMAKDAV
ncbi:uncharacterized protein [Primulina eburnea]|uniref:uncharacterized protein n=1 Tax=Primulina eburnea TaxID=1245227 RepID=UPI003C6C2850